MTRRNLLRTVTLAIAVVAGAWSFHVAYGDGRGRSQNKPAKCESCSDVCDASADPTIICVDSKTDTSFWSTYACCCCNEDYRHRGVLGPK